MSAKEETIKRYIDGLAIIDKQELRLFEAQEDAELAKETARIAENSVKRWKSDIQYSQIEVGYLIGVLQQFGMTDKEIEAVRYR